MAEDTNDAIIEVVDAIRKQFGTPLPQEFVVVFAELDASGQMTPSQTATFIEQAAEDLGYEITRKGATRASLRKKSGIYVA